MGIVGMKDLVTGTRPYTSMGTTEKKWTAEEAEEGRMLLRALAWTKSLQGKPTKIGPKGTTALTWWVSAQIASGGLDDVLKMHRILEREGMVIGNCCI